MISIANRTAFRLFLIAALLASCLFTLDVQAQTATAPCDPSWAPTLATADAGRSHPQPPVELAAFLCGAAGQPCCVNRLCGSGLACNTNNICRTCGSAGNICCAGNSCSSGLTCTGGRCAAPPPPPCGGYNQTCCSGGACGAGLACDPGHNQCIPCGFYNTYCCPYIPECSEGSCQIPGICKP
jgi:hypothetical protein